MVVSEFKPHAWKVNKQKIANKKLDAVSPVQSDHFVSNCIRLVRPNVFVRTNPPKQEDLPT